MPAVSTNEGEEMITKKENIAVILIWTLSIGAFLAACLEIGCYTYKQARILPGQCYWTNWRISDTIEIQVDQVKEYGILYHENYHLGQLVNPSTRYYVATDIFRKVFDRCDCNPLQ